MGGMALATHAAVNARFAPARKVWYNLLMSVKAVFHLNRIVAKRTVFHCFVTPQAKIMIWTQ